MASDFLARIKSSPILCDGAMGTLLYSKGIFINRSYDELNLSQPDLIRGVHHEYLQAGAEIIETNTFGANSFRLARHSLADKVDDINRAGVRLAREAAKSFDVLDPPQEIRPRLAHTPRARTRTRLFKPKAPNDMKNEDLSVKSWIITDRNRC